MSRKAGDIIPGQGVLIDCPGCRGLGYVGDVIVCSLCSGKRLLLEDGAIEANDGK